MNKETDYIIKTLKENNIVIQRYDAKHTNSVYLKMDYGVLLSLRISDHPGKPKLKYRYNLQSQIKKFRYDRAAKQFFYPINQADRLLEQILKDHQDKLTRYGEEQYEKYMESNLKENGHKRGFWKQAKII